MSRRDWNSDPHRCNGAASGNKFRIRFEMLPSASREPLLYLGSGGRGRLGGGPGQGGNCEGRWAGIVIVLVKEDSGVFQVTWGELLVVGSW